MENLTDERLVELFKGGNHDAFEELCNRYKKMIKSLARRFYLAGGDGDDLLQEGFIGLLKAAGSFDGRGSFFGYAHLCVRNALLSAVKSATSKKNIPLNYYLSLQDAPEYEQSLVDPEAEVIGKVSADELIEKIKVNLSSFEVTVLQLYMEGLSYVEIAEKLQKEAKSIDNALQRIRKKTSMLI